MISLPWKPTLTWLVFAASLHAFARPGEELWHWTTGAGILSSPAIGLDGTVYCGSDDGDLYAVSSNGELCWVFAAGEVVNGSPAIGEDGTVQVGSALGWFYALDPGGTVKWTFVASGGPGSAGLGSNGAIYFGSFYGEFSALDHHGRKRWEFATTGVIVSTLALAADHTIYLGAGDHNLSAIEGTAGLARSPWPMYRQNAQHTGRAAGSHRPRLEMPQR